jgi:hypothetical protein
VLLHLARSGYADEESWILFANEMKNKLDKNDLEHMINLRNLIFASNPELKQMIRYFEDSALKHLFSFGKYNKVKLQHDDIDSRYKMKLGYRVSKIKQTLMIQ